MKLRAALLALAATWLGCPSSGQSADGGPLEPDAGLDGGTDAGTDGGTFDAGSDAGAPDLERCPRGSTLVVETPDAGWARAGTVFSTSLYQPTDLPERPANWVDLLRPTTLSVRVTVADTVPIANCRVHWVADAGHGWLFPDGPSTSDDGRVRAVWTAGPLEAQQVSASITTDDGPQQVVIRGAALPHASRASSVHLFYAVPERWSQFSVDVTPLTFPTTTYYAAAGFAGGYLGFQNRGPSVNPPVSDKWVLFSVWDVPSGNAQLLDAGPMTCEGFAGEGTGRKCWLTYDWQVGGTYRFEVAAALGPTFTDYTAYFTDLDGGTRTALASLRHMAKVADWSTYGFIEDWYAQGPSCLETEARTAAFGNVRYQTDAGWKAVRRATFGRSYNEWHDEICANYAYGVDGDRFLWSTGGGERVSRPLLRTDVQAPVVTLP
ncbi:MAG: DUF3472 domain-containing protein [Myxococcaceae bacterium]|nr:DUF3472 domain-containing protein [Myxococcaceae bacterium]